jgi:glycosyltransferase involved in cell wall biosynthesis
MLAILCLGLSNDFEMEVVTDGQGDVPALLEGAGIVVHRLPLTTKWSFTANLAKLASLTRALKPALVHLHGQFAGSLGQIALQLAGRPRSIYTVLWPSWLDEGGPWSRLRNYSAERLSCGLASEVVAVSEHDRHELLARSLCKVGKLSIIHTAYSLQDDIVHPGQAAAEPVVGFVGRLVDQKGCEYLVRAAPLVVSAHPNVRFVVVGDGPELARLTALARELNVASAVEFVGYDPAPARRMKSMSVLAVPSIYEPLGMVPMEAMACGVAVVASAVGGLPEVVEDGVTGILVPPRDPRAIAQALIRLLDTPQDRVRMGSAARERAVRKFSPATITAQYAVLYRRVLNGSAQQK